MSLFPNILLNNRGTRNKPPPMNLMQIINAVAGKYGAVANVTSGGQPPKGTSARRTGSTRHDINVGAVDMQLLKGGKPVPHTTAAGQQLWAGFIRDLASHGLTGFGAGQGYMGPTTAHVGYGSRAVWGAGGKSRNAPGWLRQAAFAGWGTKLPANQNVGRANRADFAQMVRSEMALDAAADQYLERAYAASEPPPPVEPVTITAPQVDAKLSTPYLGIGDVMAEMYGIPRDAGNGIPA